MQAEGITPTDNSMYSVEAVEQRIDLLSDPVVVRALEDLWQVEHIRFMHCTLSWKVVNGVQH